MAQHDHSVRFSAGQHDGRSQTQRDEEEAEIGKYHDGPVMQPARRCQTVDGKEKATRGWMKIERRCIAEVDCGLDKPVDCPVDCPLPVDPAS
ncbi:hypothetical protein E4U12_002055 [Claviceps purpurea]|nr:hypothetical protein E4U12_002055 [Claviceps purpurea]